MIYSIDGNLLSMDGSIIQRKVNTLIYQMEGDVFPLSIYGTPTGSEEFTFTSSKPNTVTINYGDGVTISKNFELSGNEYKVGYSRSAIQPNWSIPVHTFLNTTTVLRDISFEFQDPEGLTSVRIGYNRMDGSLPIEIASFPNITEIFYLRIRDIKVVPDKFPKKLVKYTAAEISKIKQPRLPDSLFETSIEEMVISSTYNLGDIIESNFFKINQFKDSLERVLAHDCNMIELPNSFGECTKMTNLFLRNNYFKEIPTVVNNMVKLDYLQLGGVPLINTSMPYWSNLHKLRRLGLQFTNINLADIPQSWSKLYTFNYLESTEVLANTDQRFDQLVDSFYELVTVNGGITNDIGNFGGIYPKRFRDIAWGHASRAFTGTKQAPFGYVQGASNGTPANQGEKVYVLQNQYNHTITHA